MPALPSSTLKPCSRRVFTYQAEDSYSRQAGSASSQMFVCQVESCSFCSSTHSHAVDFGPAFLMSLIAFLPQSSKFPASASADQQFPVHEFVHAKGPQFASHAA